MSKLSKLFNNNRFNMVLSFVLAIIAWFVVSIAYSPESSRTLSQVPIEINFSDETAGYKAYSKNELFAKVDVNGKKYVVEQLGNDSVVVSASVDTVTSSGLYTLNLQARKKNAGEDYTVVSITPSTITVMIDVERQSQYNVSIDCVGATVAERQDENQSLLLEPAFMDETHGVLTATGPESEVRRISYVNAVADVNKELSASQPYTAGIVVYDQTGTVIYDANNNISSLQYVEFSYETAEIMANVNLRKVVPLTYMVSGAPANAPAISLREITGSETNQDNAVDTIGIKGAVDVISAMDEIVLDGTVDFAKIDPANPMTARFELQLPSIAGVTYDEYANLSDLYFVAMVDTDGLTSRSFDIAAADISVKNLPSGFQAKVQSALKGIVVVGPRSSVNSLSVDDFTVTVDGSGITAAGASNLVPNIVVESSSRCWIAGEYQVVVESTVP